MEIYNTNLIDTEVNLRSGDKVKANSKIYRYMHFPMPDGTDGYWIAPSGLSVQHPNTLAKIEAAIAAGKLVR